MATPNQIKEIKATLQRGLENLALTGNFKQLPLREQKSRPLLRTKLGEGPQVWNDLDNNNMISFGGVDQNGYSRTSDEFNKIRNDFNNVHIRSPQRTKTSDSAVVRAKSELGARGASVSTKEHLNSLRTKPPIPNRSLIRPISGRKPLNEPRSRQPVSGNRKQSKTNLKPKPPEVPLKGSTKPPQRQGSRDSSSEEGSAKRLGADGSSRVRRRSRVSSSEGGEEWSDVEDEDEDEDPLGSERMPGDGASFDDFEEDDGMDGLEDGEQTIDDDESDSFSIASTDSRYQITSLPSSSSVTSKTQRDGDRVSLSSRPGSRMFQYLTTGADDALPALSTSLFSNVPPTINFVGVDEKAVQFPWEIRKLLKWRMSPITPNVIKNCIARSGFRATRKANEWMGYWGKHMKAAAFKVVKDYQKVNHLPGSFQIGRKDRLWRNLYKMQVHFGKRDFNFFPQTYVLPFDLKLLKRAWEDGGTKQKWILKPPASARGIGIRVIHKWNQIPRRKPVIVQRYLAKPFLINGSKFDLRIYVYVKSYDPLRIYIFQDGLARFATMKYNASMKSLSNKFMHLTNYSINKKNADFTPNTDFTACEGHKWGLKALWGYLKPMGIDTNAIWENIKEVVVKTIISVDSTVNSMVKLNVKSRYCVHELFGFDVMLDENLKPWILEVNISPSLHSNSPLDVSIKGEMIKDLLNISGFNIPDKKDVYPMLASSSSSSKVRGSDIFMDKRLFQTQLSQDERAKHAFYTQKHIDEQCRMSILDTLTPDDLRVLVETEDEYSRCGGFERVFPAPSAQKFLRFFETARYYNILLNEWVKKYERQHAKGLSLLEDYCSEGVHLANSKDNSHVQWSPLFSPRFKPWSPISNVIQARDPRTSSAPVTSAPSPTTGIKKSSSANNLPKIRRRPPAKARALSSTGSNVSISSTASKSSAHSHPHPPRGLYAPQRRTVTDMTTPS
ncbi:tubulin polyglutamylase TTLL4-like isoform X1 [Asterias rubens]|uniref:tubulin polyglutamylase TTLL4-like isoform X1 n=1 Tax=Asterias rubens TaxID=7604 RepID=UPI001455628B|nr:tubulin polyglutamylase TTLL4-like isoform X1 [Asterias rubens]XP_033639694.1 tubulin polyglutamylase TTLL4-like isoform X1 [Asterias rubens]